MMGGGNAGGYYSFLGNAALLARVCGVSKFVFVLMIITLFSFSSVPHCVKSCPIFCVANGLGFVDLKKY